MSELLALISEHPLVTGGLLGGLLTELIRRAGATKVAAIEATTKRDELAHASTISLIDEMQKQLERMQERLKHVEKELDEWKANYYSLYEEKAKLAVEVERLKGENMILQIRHENCLAKHIQD